jgi:hypothetical protein
MEARAGSMGRTSSSESSSMVDDGELESDLEDEEEDEVRVLSAPTPHPPPHAQDPGCMCH